MRRVLGVYRVLRNPPPPTKLVLRYGNPASRGAEAPAVTIIGVPDPAAAELRDLPMQMQFFCPLTAERIDFAILGVISVLFIFFELVYFLYVRR